MAYRLIDCPIRHPMLGGGFPTIRVLAANGFGADSGFGLLFDSAGFFEIHDFNVDYEDTTTLRISLDCKYYDEYNVSNIKHKQNLYVLKAVNKDMELTVLLGC